MPQSDSQPETVLRKEESSPEEEWLQEEVPWLVPQEK
jgi:hypothetical protein